MRSGSKSERMAGSGGWEFCSSRFTTLKWIPRLQCALHACQMGINTRRRHIEVWSGKVQQYSLAFSRRTLVSHTKCRLWSWYVVLFENYMYAACRCIIFFQFFHIFARQWSRLYSSAGVSLQQVFSIGLDMASEVGKALYTLCSVILNAASCNDSYLIALLLHGSILLQSPTSDHSAAHECKCGLSK